MTNEQEKMIEKLRDEVVAAGDAERSMCDKIVQPVRRKLSDATKATILDTIKLFRPDPPEITAQPSMCLGC